MNRFFFSSIWYCSIGIELDNQYYRKFARLFFSLFFFLRNFVLDVALLN